MNEHITTDALRLAKLILEKPRKGRMSEAQLIARALIISLDKVPPPPLPDPPASEDETTVDIRWMLRRDMPEVLEIEGNSFPNPWDEQRFIEVLRQRNCIGMVARVGEKPEYVIGFFIYELHKTKLCLINLAVHEKWRRRGVGRQMIDKLKSKLSPQRRSMLRLSIRESNLPGQLFFRANGLEAVDMEKDVFEDSDEDAIVMQYLHASTANT